MNKVKRRFPNFIGYMEEDLTEHTFETLDELYQIEWINRLTKQKHFHRLSNGETRPDGKIALMYEIHGGKNYFVVGWLNRASSELPQWQRRVTE